MQVYTMEIIQKNVKVDNQTISIYGKTVWVACQIGWGISLKTVFGYELAPLPSSMFDEFGLIRMKSYSTIDCIQVH